MTFWHKKISALLHDPLTKAFDIAKHEELTKQICEIAGIEMTPGGSEEDRIASGFDRFPIPFERFGKQIRVSFDQLTHFVHPLSTCELKVGYEKIDQQSYVEKLKNDISQLRKMNQDDEKFYHALWWELSNIVDMAQFLPADTRILNHSIIDHVDLTAAVKACIEGEKTNASLTMISIGPVQEVISQARKTIDLWAGSYLLSYLIYQAIEYIGWNYGFDSIIYPYLRGNNFVRKTLQEHGVKLLSQGFVPQADEKIASLPNVVLGLLPANKSNEIIESCKSRIRDKWREIALQALRELKDSKILAAINMEEYEKQIELFPTINAAQVNLMNDLDVLETIKHISKDPDFQRYKELLKKISEHGGYAYNAGTFYKYIYRMLISKMNAIKIIRYFKGYSSDAVLTNHRNADDFGDYVRACAEVIDKQKDDEHRDLLGTLNATKRVLKSVLNMRNIRYESTEDVARQNEDYDRNKYIAVLMMDGDNMGKWISGDKAPRAEDVIHPMVKEAMKSTDIGPESLSHRFLTPSYHRAISRTLGIFSFFVSYVVEEEYKGMLIYAGGDDVLAILPADKVLECANKLRKMYSGIGNEKLTMNGNEYEFKNEMLFVNGKPYTIMMGKNASMSAGICVIHQRSPLRVGIQTAREAEHYAKEVVKRNAFAVFAIRRSGQTERVGSKWDIDDLDIISKALEIHDLCEKVEFSHRSLYKLRQEDFQVSLDEHIEHFVDYIIKRSDVKNKQSPEFKKLSSTMKEFMIKLSNRKLNNLKDAIDLLRMIRFTKRGENQ